MCTVANHFPQYLQFHTRLHRFRRSPKASCRLRPFPSASHHPHQVPAAPRSPTSSLAPHG
eukprot:4738954-Alexandrium_andersonii.AAC.1